MASLKFPLEAATDVFWTINRCVEESVDPRAAGTPSHLPKNPGKFYTTMTYQRKHNIHKLWVNRMPVEKRPKKKASVVRLKIIESATAAGETTTFGSQTFTQTLTDTQSIRQSKSTLISKVSALPQIVQQKKHLVPLSEKSSFLEYASAVNSETVMTATLSDDDMDPPEKDEALKTYSKYQLYYKGFNDSIDASPLRSVHRQVDTYHLDLRFINIPYTEFKAICFTLLSCPMISRLDLTEVYIDDTKAVYLTELFKDNNFLTDLVLRNCQLGYRQMKRILDTVRDRDNLVYLDVSENNLKDDSAFLLAKYIEGASALIYLLMSKNQFGELAGRYFGMAVGDNYYLRYLDVSLNNIRRDGARLFLSGVARNHNLDTIDMSWNAIREDGAYIIKKVLDNPELRRIDLTGTGMNSVCMQQIVAGLKKNSTLEYIGLRNNPLMVEDLTLLLDTVSHNVESGLLKIDLGYQTVEKRAITIAKDLALHRHIDILYGNQLESDVFMFGDQMGMIRMNVALDAIKKLKPDKRVAVANYFKVLDAGSGTSLNKKKCSFNAQAERGVISYRAFALRIMMAGDQAEKIIEEAEKLMVTQEKVPGGPNLSVIRAEPDFFVVRDMELKAAFRADMEDMTAMYAKEPEAVKFT